MFIQVACRICKIKCRKFPNANSSIYTNISIYKFHSKFNRQTFNLKLQFTSVIFKIGSDVNPYLQVRDDIYDDFAESDEDMISIQESDDDVQVLVSLNCLSILFLTIEQLSLAM